MQETMGIRICIQLLSAQLKTSDLLTVEVMASAYVSLVISKTAISWIAADAVYHSEK